MKTESGSAGLKIIGPAVCLSKTGRGAAPSGMMLPCMPLLRAKEKSTSPVSARRRRKVDLAMRKIIMLQMTEPFALDKIRKRNDRRGDNGIEQGENKILRPGGGKPGEYPGIGACFFDPFQHPGNPDKRGQIAHGRGSVFQHRIMGKIVMIREIEKEALNIYALGIFFHKADKAMEMIGMGMGKIQAAMRGRSCVQPAFRHS